MRKIKVKIKKTDLSDMSHVKEIQSYSWCNNFSEVMGKLKSHIKNFASEKNSIFSDGFLFFHNRKFCFECLRTYYDFRSTVSKKSELNILNMTDTERIAKMFKSKMKKYAMFEIIVYNWKMFKNTFLRNECVKTLKNCIGKNVGPFNRLSFSHIVLLLFHESTLSKYVAMTLSAHLINDTLFLHTNYTEWEYLIEFIDFYSNKVFKSNTYYDFNITGWIYAVFTYMSIEGTYFDDRIVGIVNRLFFELDHLQCKAGIYMMVLALSRRDVSMMYKCEKIYESALDYKLLRFVISLQPNSLKYTENMIFWHPVYFYIYAFPIYCKLRLENKYFAFFSEISDDFYKRELYISILRNTYCITSVKEFMYTFPFFEELVIECLKFKLGDTNYLLKLNPDFVILCSKKTCNLIFKCERYQDSQWEILYTIIYKWFKISTFIMHEISDKKDSMDVKQLLGFVLIVYYDVEKYLWQNCPSSKVTDLFINFRNKILSTIMISKKNFPVEFYDENIIYIAIVRHHITNSVIPPKFYGLLEEDALARIIDKHCVFQKKFGYSTPYFISFIEILKKIPKISLYIYERYFMMLLNKSLTFEICELIYLSIEKIEVCQRDLQENYISSLNWYNILEKINDDRFFEIKKKVIYGNMRFLHQNSCKLNEEQNQKYINISKLYGLYDLYRHLNK